MSAEKKLIFVRHGVTEYNLAKRYIGSTDAALAPEGERQAANLKGPIYALAPEKIICSPMRRAVETAEIATEGLDLEIEIDADLREVDFGKWEGLTFDEIEAIYGEQALRWIRWESDYRFPDGETIGEFLGRVRKVAGRLAEDPAESIAVFSHSGVIRQLMLFYMSLPPDRFFSFKVKPGAISVIGVTGGAGCLTDLWRPGDLGSL